MKPLQKSEDWCDTLQFAVLVRTLATETEENGYIILCFLLVTMVLLICGRISVFLFQSLQSIAVF